MSLDGIAFIHAKLFTSCIHPDFLKTLKVYEIWILIVFIKY